MGDLDEEELSLRDDPSECWQFDASKVPLTVTSYFLDFGTLGVAQPVRAI